MNNKTALEFWEKKTKEASENPYCVRISKKYKDFPVYDAEFISKYINNESKLLDLGSGTGLIVNKIYDKVKSIDCVEPFEEFSKHIVKSKNIKVFNCSVLDYNTNIEYDLITIFGLMQYFNQDESIEIYKKCRKYLKPQGKIIIKQQFGTKEDVLVNNFSEELQSNYFSQYRYVNKEVKLLESHGFKNVETFDIYPPEANRWDNTHFYAIVAERN